MDGLDSVGKYLMFSVHHWLVLVIVRMSWKLCKQFLLLFVCRPRASCSYVGEDSMFGHFVTVTYSILSVGFVTCFIH